MLVQVQPRDHYTKVTMREITHLVVHCSATKAAQDIGRAEINEWHVARGFNEIGYHYVIRRDGTIENGRPIEQIGAHVAGHNSTTIGICLVGGLDEKSRAQNNFTRDQFQSLAVTLLELRAQFPKAKIIGHRDFPNVHKDCPCFDVRHWCMTQGIDAEPQA